jgi:hypothetical protein
MKTARLTAPVLVPLLLICPLLLSSCSVGRKLTPQSDISAYTVGDEEFETRILFASRDSDFKVEVARRIGEALKDRPVYVKFVGIDQLGGEDASAYSAVIILTTCLAWGMDSTTESFLRDNNDFDNIIVLITSGAGDWTPDMEGRNFDAVTSASVLADAESVADEILGKVYALIDRGS